MRFKYFLVLILLVIQSLILFIEYKESKNLKQISLIFERKENVFTNKGEAMFRQSILCMSNKTKSFFEKIYKRKISNEDYMDILGRIINSYPIQVKNTTTKDKLLTTEVFFDFPKPIVVEFTAIKVDGVYKIDNIGNLCELFDYANSYFEDKTI